MKTLRGKGDYKAPPIGVIEGAYLDTGAARASGYRFALMMVKPEFIRARRAKSRVHAQPTAFALSEDGKYFMLWPTPAARWDFVVRFFPPMIEV